MYNYTGTCLYLYKVHVFCANVCIPSTTKCVDASSPDTPNTTGDQGSMYMCGCVFCYIVFSILCVCMFRCVFCVFSVLCVFVPSTTKCPGASSQDTPVATKRKSRPLFKRKGQMMLLLQGKRRGLKFVHAGSYSMSCLVNWVSYEILISGSLRHFAPLCL